jgi:hypothetical protein
VRRVSRDARSVGGHSRTPREDASAYLRRVKLRHRVARALIVSLVTIVAGCGFVGSTPSSNLTSVALRTWPSMSPSDACMQALATGPLVLDPVSGLGLANPSGQVIHVQWPFGYTARQDAARLALVDPEGRIIAHVEDVISIGGGNIPDDTWIACPFERVRLVSTPSP